MRTLLTIVLTICSFSLHLLASANEPVKKAAVREIELKELRIKPNRPFQKPVVIASLNELAKGLDMCLKEQLPHELAKHVDFKNEQILFFAWSGSSEDKFAFQMQECNVTKVTFQYERGRTDDARRHFRMIVMPKNASWSVAVLQNRAD